MTPTDLNLANADTARNTGELDRAQGHSEYWGRGFEFKTLSQGTATHIFAAFSPELEAPGENQAPG
jgi:hypothetical protein